MAQQTWRRGNLMQPTSSLGEAALPLNVCGFVILCLAKRTQVNE
jgi:hypothetical protein